MATNGFDDDQTRSFTELTNGTKVSHYTIISKIGAGGMGEVYLADDTQLDRKVALKFLPAHLCRDNDCRARFKREAQAVAKLNHPNIVTIFEVAEFNERPFFAMELVEGQSLKDLIKGKALDLDRIIELAIQIFDGLSAAHDKKIVHRDVKPSNIVIDAYGRPKILDFGLASIQGAEHLTKTGSTLGTIRYMSPEQAQGKEADHRSDLFSVGVVLYELIAGRTPFEKDNEAATLKSITQDAHEPLARYKSDIPDELQRTVSKLLEKTPSLRYQHADGVISDLKRLTSKKTTEVSIAPKKDWWNRYIVVIAAVILLVSFGSGPVNNYFSDSSLIAESETKSLVVLPFENLGAEEDEYFAAGMTDEITARLAGFSGLRVISRTSAVHYKDSGKPLKEIARELNVDYVLEGTIRWDKSGDTDRVRIIPQLIRASDDSHVWASTFERALTQVFAVQADIATRIAEALDVTLLEPEEQLLAAKPTDNLEAYSYYLRGKEYWVQSNFSGRAIEMLEKAVTLDSNFYTAYALLTQMYGYEYINNVQLTDERKAQAKEAADKAFRLANGKPEGYLALGYYHYYISRDYDLAMEYFNQASAGQPNNSELISAIAYVQRRKGNWEIAVEKLEKAIKLNPFSQNEPGGLISTLLRMHRIDEALKVNDQALKLAPDAHGLLLWKIIISFYLGAEVSEVDKAIEEYALWAPTSESGFILETSDIFRHKFQSALTRRKTNISAKDFLLKGSVYMFLDDSSMSHIYYDSARVICEEKIIKTPGFALIHSEYAEALAGLGQKEIAIKEAELAVKLLPVSKDELQGADIIQYLTKVYIMVGEYDLAIDQLDYLLSHPSMVQIVGVQNHPIYDPLRELPRFKELLEKYSK